MVRLVETANVDYCLSFADQGNQTSTYFPFSVCRKQTEVALFC